jgi:hypothetical protein
MQHVAVKQSATKFGNAGFTRVDAFGETQRLDKCQTERKTFKARGPAGSTKINRIAADEGRQDAFDCLPS